MFNLAKPWDLKVFGINLRPIQKKKKRVVELLSMQFPMNSRIGWDFYSHTHLKRSIGRLDFVFRHL